MMLLLLAKVDLCSMPSTTAVYTIEGALQCLNVPVLTQEVFNQTQTTVEHLAGLYAFYDTAKSPPGEYAKLALNIEAELSRVRSQYEGVQNAKAFDYFSALSGLFTKLKDPHTLFVKPSFFKNFRKHLPFSLVHKDGKWYIENLPENHRFVQSSYSAQQFTEKFDEMFGKQVYQLNGLSVDQYVLQQSEKYCYHSKSAQACFNSYVSNDMYYQNLFVYNIPSTQDRYVRVTTMDGETYMIEYVMTTQTPINNSTVAQELYDRKKAIQYTSEDAKQRLQHPLRELDLVATHSRKSDEEFEIVLQKSFYTLYMYHSELVLAIESFSADFEIQGVNDLIVLMQYLRENKTDSGKLFITVVGNGGGLVTLGHLMSFMMFPNEFPIYGRYNLRKSYVFELLVKSFSNFEDMHRTDWITGDTIADSVLSANYTPSADWYYKGDANQTIYYAFDDDQAPWLQKALDVVYNFEGIEYDPENIILVTDGLCGSTCACFTKHLLQLRKIRAVGIGGTLESKDTFDVSSFAGGTVQDSVSVESAIEELGENTTLNETEMQYLKSLYMPHDGYFRFAHEIIYSFDTLEDPGTPLEFRTFPVEHIFTDVHPFFGDYQGPTGIKTYIDKVIEYATSTQVPAFGEVCSQKKHIEYRKYAGDCVAHSCRYGYYKKADKGAFKCVVRSDHWSHYTMENEHTLNAGEISAIVLLVVACLTAVALIICFLLKPQWFKCCARAKLDEQEALRDNIEEL